MITVFASLSAYVTGRLAGQKAASALVTELVKRGAAAADIPELLQPALAGALTLHRLAALYSTTLQVDGGGTRIAVTRSRHLYEAEKSGADVWVTVDDDVEASERTLRWLVEAVTSDSEPRVCVAPCLLRESSVANVEWHPLYLTRRLEGGGKARRIIRAGFGLVAVNRKAMKLVSERSSLFRDSDGQLKPTAFLETYDADTQRWHGEDSSFFRRLPEAVLSEALVTGETGHGGAALDFQTLDG